MKNLALLIALIFTFGVLVNAQTQNPIAIHVPFDFYVQDQKMKAGDYVVQSVSLQSAQPILVFRQKNGKARKIVMTIPTEINNGQTLDNPTILFNQYGYVYYLAEISNPWEKRVFELPKTKEEKSLARNFGKPKQESIAMSLVQK